MRSLSSLIGLVARIATAVAIPFAHVGLAQATEAAAMPRPDAETAVETAFEAAADPVGDATAGEAAIGSGAVAVTVGEDADGGPVVDPDEMVEDRDGPQMPVLLAPVDRWREDPTIAFVATDVVLDDFMWIARPVVVFADSPADPAFQRQVDLLLARADDLVRRDVVLITDTDPAAMSEIRRALRPRGFMLALLGKDGGVKLRKPLPWDVRELGRSIDKMPLRLQELRDERNSNQ